MNKITLYFFVAISLVSLNSCRKGKKLPLVTTSAITPGIVTAQIAGVIYDEGDSKVIEKGICWSEQQNVSISNNKMVNSTEDLAFTTQITGLREDKTYYARAYAKSALGVSYGSEVSFRTLSADLPYLSVISINTPSTTSAEVVLSLSQNYISTYTTGICWSTNPLPTVSNNTLMINQVSQNDPVPFHHTYYPILQNLLDGTTYYVRAFSTNGVNISYSNEITFTTTSIVSVNFLTFLGITNATVSSLISNINVSNITAVGTCWSVNQQPTIADSKIEQAYSGANYNISLSPLAPSTVYYLRSYVKTATQIYYSQQKAIKTYKDLVQDIDGNVYYTVQIGAQEWMSSNLKTTRFNTGTNIPYTSNYNQWVNYVNAFTPVYCYYNDMSSYNSGYGKLYPGYVASNANIAPIGWHVPTVVEWQTLLASNTMDDLWKGSSLWYTNNITGLSLLAGGKWEMGYSDMNSTGYYWASPYTSSNNSIEVASNSNLITWYGSGNGLSIRCVKN